MDKLDLQIMTKLMQDSRMPVTQLAKKVGVSREVANYRLSKLKEDKVILNFVTEINLARLGYIGAAVFANVKATRQKEFIGFLGSCSFASWVAELAGVWSCGLSVYGKTNDELDEKFLTIYEGFKTDIIDHRFTLHRRSLFFYEKYFGAPPKPEKHKRHTEYKLDVKDKLILKELALNSRISSVELAKKVSLSAPAAIQRMRNLENGGYIDKYSIFVDISKLGLFQYSVFIVNKNIDERERLISYLTNHESVPFIAEYVGDPFMEFGLIVKDPYELRKILQGIEEAFPDNRVIEISLFQKEVVSVGPPPCVFE